MKSLLKKLAKKIIYSKPVGKLFELGFNAMWRSKYDSFRKTYNIDPSFNFNGIGTQLYGNGEIVLGKNSYIGNYSTIQAQSGCKVVVGANCAISHNVRIYTANRSARDVVKGINKKEASILIGDVLIDDGVWIGANVVVLQGVSIGKYSVIGANSVVNKSIPDHCVAGGVPAKVINSVQTVEEVIDDSSDV